VEFRVLGPLEVVGDDGGVVPLGGPRQRALLGALLLDAGRAVPTGRLVETVWELPPASAEHAVQVYVSKLRKALAATGGGGERIVLRRGGYAALVEPEELDLARFRALTREAAAAGDPEAAARALSAALALWRGEPLACLDRVPVAEHARSALQEERLAAVEARVDAELALCRHAELVGELRRLVAAHPEREALWARLMLALYRSGRQTEALETFTLARTRLVELLGLEPGRELRELQRRVLEQDPTLETTAPLVSAASRRRVRLPSPPSSFVGREAELAAAGTLLAEGGTRLLSVLGPGGIGKTRFAIELARTVAGRFEEVAWVGLESLQDHALVPAEIARALDVDTVSRDPVDAVSRELGEQRVLLVLDNLEHLLEAAGELHRLLTLAPGLHVVVTSREPLRLSSEQRYLLGPLHAADATRLFATRARAVGAAVDPADPAVDSLCAHLDQLPLAIELAASHADSQSPTELLMVLDRALDLDGRRDPAQRQRTLRATIDWSYRLLDDEQQRIFRALGVFAGGCTPEAAEQVAGATAAALQTIVDTSLLNASNERYSLLETIRRFARQQLETIGELEALITAHAAYFAATIGPMWRSIRNFDEEATAALDIDLDNARLALVSAFGAHDGDMAAALLVGLMPYWLRRGLPGEAMTAAERYLALDRGRVASAARLEGDLAASEILRFFGDPLRARTLKLECLDLARRRPELELPNLGVNGRSAVMALLSDLSDLDLRFEDAKAARLHATESLALRRGEDTPNGIAHALNAVSIVEQYEGRFDEAAAAAEESAEILESIGSREVHSARIGQAESELLRGRTSVAIELLIEHLPALDPQEDALDGIYGLLVAMQVLAARERHDDVRVLGDTVRDLLEETGFVLPPWDAERLGSLLQAYDSGDAADGSDAVLTPDQALRVAIEALRGLDRP
jgi:predicted ATPase/DNA-binding SARP family transcriptional activator